MELRDSVETLAELRDRVDDVETMSRSLRLSDVRLSVSANCPRDADTAAVRPRILPAFKCRSPLRRSRRATADPAAKCRQPPRDVTSSCDVITPPSNIDDVDVDVINTAAVVCPGSCDVEGRPVMVAFCQQSDVFTDEQCITQLAQLLLYHCITCCTPVLRCATCQSRTCISYVTALCPGCGASR